jgi:hypothetical protein
MGMSRTRPAAYESWPTSSPVPGGQAPEVPPDNPLTTKEGWKTFVARSPQPPVLLNTSELQLCQRGGPQNWSGDATTTPICRW